MSIDAVFLDLGGVILKVDWKPVLIEMGFTDPQTQKEIISKVADWEDHYRFERGQISEPDFFKGLGELIQIPDTPKLITSWNKMIVGELPGVEGIFQFKDRVPLMALSNTNPTHLHYLNQNFSTLKRFNHVFASFELGHRKPEADIFLKAAELAKATPKRILFIDDNPENVEAASHLGFQAYLSEDSTAETIRIIKAHL